MKNRGLLSQPSLREEKDFIIESEEKETSCNEVLQKNLKPSNVYSMLYLNQEVEDVIVKEMIAYACGIAEGSEKLFPVRFSNVNGRKALIISCNFNNPMEVEELLSASYAAYLSPDA